MALRTHVLVTKSSEVGSLRNRQGMHHNAIAEKQSFTET
jgi:hypothetical protein